MIQVLSQETINQIAAGEVIDRPAAVVKELVENSIDAGATAITIEIKDGGLSFIRITDNGCGIAGDEIKTAFLRHATSKIQTKEDLLTVTSLGFRGEALSSIAAVAQVELVTKRAGDITGARYEIAGGKENGLQEIGCPDGTTFVVRNLFYNTPARRKFLKTKVTEGSYVQKSIPGDGGFFEAMYRIWYSVIPWRMRISAFILSWTVRAGYRHPGTET